MAQVWRIRLNQWMQCNFRAGTGQRFRFQDAIGVSGKRETRIDIKRPRNHERAQQKKSPKREHQGGALMQIRISKSEFRV